MTFKSIWKYVRYICYLQMSIGSILGILIVLVRKDYSLGLAVLFLGIVGILLTLLNDVQASEKEV